jgi:hypothetical protein
MRLLVGWFGLVGACLSVACSGETSDGDTLARGGRGGSAGVAGNAGTGMMGGPGGTGASDPDAGPSGSGGTGQGGTGQAGSGGCPVAAPVRIPGHTFAIYAINVTRKVLVLKNLSGAPVTIDTEWQWCSIPKYGRLVEETRTIPADGLHFLDISDSFQGTVDGGDMGIYIRPAYMDPNSIDTYVIWGEDFESGLRENVAAQAFIWTFGERAIIRPGDAGLIATGRTDSPSGYASAPAECF